MQWTPQEDQCLLELFHEIQVYNRWKEISKKMQNLGFHKNEIECRNRYQNKLNPTLSKDKWTIEEIQKLFQSYNQYGSKWNLIEVFLPGRTQNNIKNRFFSMLKNLLRKLLKNFLQSSQKKMKYISSRDITDLYQGKARFKKFKGLLIRILKKIDFEIESQSLDSLIDEQNTTLKKLFQVFYQNSEKKENASDEDKKNIQKASESNCTEQKNNQQHLINSLPEINHKQIFQESNFANFASIFDFSLHNGLYFPQMANWSFDLHQSINSTFIPVQIIPPTPQFLSP